MRLKILLLAAVAVGAALPAQAVKRHRVVDAEPPSVTIQKRSYLEPSNQVPVGSYNSYVQESTTLGAAFVARDFERDRIGESNLPTRFFAPGWTGPQFDRFDTGYYTNGY